MKNVKVQVQDSDIQTLKFGDTLICVRAMKINGRLYFGTSDVGFCILPDNSSNIKVWARKYVPAEHFLVVSVVHETYTRLLSVLDLDGIQFLMRSPIAKRTRQFQAFLDLHCPTLELELRNIICEGLEPNPAMVMEHVNVKETVEPDTPDKPAEPVVAESTESTKSTNDLPVSANKEFVLWTSRQFDGITFDCYVEQDQKIPDEFWMTREQIGRLLEYSDPMRSIAHIHERNADRFSKFSTVTKLVTVQGSQMVTRNVIVYNFRGLLEICRWSNQPKANAVMDCLWEIADEIRRTGQYVSKVVGINANQTNPDNQTLLDQMQQLSQQVHEMQEDIAKDRKSKVDYDKRITIAKVLKYKLTITVAQMAALLSPEGPGNVIEKDDIFCWFRENGYCRKDLNDDWNRPTKESLLNAYMTSRPVTITDTLTGEPKTYMQTLITAKGLQYFLNLRRQGETFVYFPDALLAYFNAKEPEPEPTKKRVLVGVPIEPVFDDQPKKAGKRKA